MRNLAGHPEATALFREELAAAGIAAVDVAPEGETRCAAEGVVPLAGGFELRVVRRWCYASARIEPPLPVALAREVNDAPCAIEGGRYSGATGTLGAVARAHGDAGGRPSADIATAVEHWHVDHADALRPLVDALDATIAAHGLSAPDARTEYQRAWTEELLGELARLDRGSHLWRWCLRSLLTDARADWTNPRMGALFADARAEVVEMLRGAP